MQLTKNDNINKNQDHLAKINTFVLGYEQNYVEDIGCPTKKISCHPFATSVLSLN